MVLESHLQDATVSYLEFSFGYVILFHFAKYTLNQQVLFLKCMFNRDVFSSGEVDVDAS